MLPNITNRIPISSGKRLSITTASTIPAAIIKAVFMLPPFKKFIVNLAEPFNDNDPQDRAYKI
jgi:hypothetical protein